MQVTMLQEDLKTEVLVVEEKKARTFALIESIGQEKTVVDEAVESSRADEEAAAQLQVRLSLPINSHHLLKLTDHAYHGFWWERSTVPLLRS